MERKSNGLSIAAMVLGIVGLLLSCLFIGIIPAILGLIFGIIALSTHQSKGMSISGIVCSSIGMFIFLCSFIASLNKNTIESESSDVPQEKTIISGTEYQKPDSEQEDSLSEWAYNYTPINEFRYTLDKDSKTITLVRYEGDATKILLSPVYTIDGVDYNMISMGDNACFLSETYITSVYIPEGVTFVGDSCFNSCASLEYIYLPSTIEELGSGFFDYLDNYEVYCNSSVSSPSSRDTNDYPEKQDDTSNAAELGESTARALNGFLAGLNNSNSDPIVTKIYYGGTDEQWHELTGQ